MKVLVTNDDGIQSPGLWALVNELKCVAQVVVVAPDRERSAIGTAVTLYSPLIANEIEPGVPGVKAYSVSGTPGDSVILALTKLVKDQIDMVISGINQGPNLGDDVLISGTVAAAIQGYLHGLPSLALSVDSWINPHFDSAARLAVLLTTMIESGVLPKDIFLNVNLPNLTKSEIKGIRITKLAHRSHIDTADEVHDGNQAHYILIRRRLSNNNDNNTDIEAIEQSCISITPLHANLSYKSTLNIAESLCAELFEGL